MIDDMLKIAVDPIFKPRV